MEHPTCSVCIYIIYIFIPQCKKNDQLFGYECGSKRCEVCLNINETSTFAITVTGETYIINHEIIVITSP